MSRSDPWTSLVQTFRASPAKSAVLGLLGVVLLVMVVRQFSNGPDDAGAAPMSGLALSPDMMPAATPTPSETSAPTARPPLPNFPTKPSRNLFAASWDLYAHASRTNANEYETPAEEPVTENTVLTLELTLTTPTDDGVPQAVINGRSLRIGDSIGVYAVESIAPGRVVLTTGENERVALYMN